MKRVRAIFSGCVIVVTFLFLPSENWAFWFVGGKQDMYGEFQVAASKRSFLLAKNVGGKKVKLHGEQVIAHWTRAIEGGPVVALGRDADVPPLSYSLVETGLANPDGLDPPVRRPGDESYFEVRELALSVPAEQDKWAFLVLFLLVASCTLSLSVATYLSESGGAAEGTEPES